MEKNIPLIVIAIDGYSSSGKSTMAKSLAKRVGYRYIDSGAMYRAVTLWAMRHGMVNAMHEIDTDALVAALDQIHIDFKVQDGAQRTLLNGEDVEHEIRQLAVSNNVSQVAAIPAVRHRLVELQRYMGESKGIVMDGRDIGTTVFPDAELKIFVDASAERRAQRRLKELADGGHSVGYEEVLANIVQRDHIDRTRAESPLRQAADAIAVDNTTMTIEQQDAWLLEQFEKAVNRQLQQ